MSFLKEVGFTEAEIAVLESSISDQELFKKLCEFPVLVIDNINYLKELGVTNYKDVFSRYQDMFLNDHTDFKEKFAKYDPEDLVDKISKNVEIVEYL